MPVADGGDGLLEVLGGITAASGGTVTMNGRALDLSAILASAATRNENAPYCTEARNPPYDTGRLNLQGEAGR